MLLNRSSVSIFYLFIYLLFETSSHVAQANLELSPPVFASGVLVLQACIIMPSSLTLCTVFLCSWCWSSRQALDKCSATELCPQSLLW